MVLTRVPCNAANSCIEDRRILCLARRNMHQMDLWEALRLARRRMDMVAAKVSAKLQRLLNRQIGKVLVPKSNHTALRYEERELVLAGIGERGELDTTHFRAELGSEILESGDTLGKKVREARVGGLSALGVLKGNKRIVAIEKRRIESAYGL